MFKMRTISLLFGFAYVCNIGLSCTRISVEGGEFEGVDWLDGVFEVDPTLQYDDRFAYREVNGTRVIYHYSGNNGPNGERDAGRWMLGSMESIGTDSGWAYLSSWSISPDDLTVSSIQNNEEVTNLWKVFTDDTWQDVDNLKFVCESAFGDYDPMNDFLFVTTEDLFEDKELTFQSIHGFYLRIDEDTFKKIGGQKAIYFQEKADVTEIFIMQEASKSTPNNNGVSAVKAPTNNKLSKLSSDGIWRLITSDGKTIENVNVTVLQTYNEVDSDSDDAETIYDLMRRFYRENKLEHNKAKDIPVVELNNGLVFPMITLGTGSLRSKSENDAIIREAIYQHGFIAIDSASSYESESSIGSLFADNKTLRAGLFLISKAWSTKSSFQETLNAVQKTLVSMKVNYVDLYFINWPACYDLSVECSNSKDEKWEQSYEALLKLYGEGIILNIGVSDAEEELIEALLQEFSVKPQVVQNLIDLNDLNWDFYDLFNEQKILLQAYGTHRQLLQDNDPENVELRNSLEILTEEIEEDQKVKVSMQQLVLRFLFENSIGVVPRSSKSPHVKENNDIFKFEWGNDYNIRMGGRPEEKTEL